MNNIQSEMEYEDFILNELNEKNGFRIRSNKNYEPRCAMDTELLFEFLNTTQPEEMEALRKIYKNDLEATLINTINEYILQKDGNLINTLKNGIELSNHKLKLVQKKVATSYNPELTKKYSQNIFSVMKEVVISARERIDIVLFLNGIAITAIELKCNFAGQSVENAITQFRTERDPNNRLFLFKKGVLVSFAMDLNEVFMTTKLDGTKTSFMPFNQGKGEGIDRGAGNPLNKNKYSVSYMWEDIFTKDTLIDLISNYIFIEKKEEEDPLTEKKVIKESLIFPRYHQLDCVRKLLDDVRENKTAQNYLIQHSAGSGKTDTIAWLAYKLSTFHDEDNKQIYDNIVVVTDRVVVDRQLQRALNAIDHVEGKLRLMDEKCNSGHLKAALEGSTKIIATTIQKFPYIVKSIKEIGNKTFAVIVDEAHSSTAGKDMEAMLETLSKDKDIEKIYENGAEDIVTETIIKSGKRENMSIFAFTATPKATTLQLFGRKNTKGQREPFHSYTMKQAIEEGYILDVLQNYTTYKTYYDLNKAIQDDPKYKTRKAKKNIIRLANLHETNIAQRVEIIIENFRDQIAPELGGNAKAMVVTSSREEAIKYSKAINEYIEVNHYSNVHSLVAFSGTYTDRKTEESYSESKINGFSESLTADRFDSKDYNVLIVANKYQTGFDQKKLAAMYILKPLRGVNAVQTLSRLNRVYAPYDKKTFILDFVNDYDDIVKAFEPYYTVTTLTNEVRPEDMYELESKVDGFYLLDPDYVDMFYEHLEKGIITSNDKARLNWYMSKTQDEFQKREEKEQREILKTFRAYVKIYEFITQATLFSDLEIHKKYVYISNLLSYLSISNGGEGYDLENKIIATNFVQKKNKEVTNSGLTNSRPVSLPKVETMLTEDIEEELSKIIAELNMVNGTNFETEEATIVMLEMKDDMKKDDSLRTSANNNTVDDFEYPLLDNCEQYLVNIREKHDKLCDKLLSNKSILTRLVKLYQHEIYSSLNENKKTEEEPVESKNELEDDK